MSHAAQIVIWFGPEDSGVEYQCKSCMDEKEEYQIKVKAKDDHGAESDWADPFGVSMPKNKVVNSPVPRFLQRPENCFSWLERLFSSFLIFTKLLDR